MNNQIIVITGPTAAGKSTVAKKVAKQIENSVNIDVDHIKHLVVSKFKYDKTKAGQRQWKLLGDNIGLLAKNFNKAGYNVIINGVLYENSWLAIQKHVEFTHKFLLLPKQETLKKRDIEREKDYRMGVKAIVSHHNYFSTNPHYMDYKVIDSSNVSIEDTVKNILDNINPK